MRTNRIEILRRSTIFSGLNDSELTELAELSVERRFSVGEFIFWEGDAPDRFYMVAEGKVKVLKNSSLGKEFIIAFFGPGEMFGEVAVLGNRLYPASAQSESGTTVLEIGRQDFLSFLARHSGIALNIIAILGGRLIDAQSRLRDLAGERVEQRLVSVMLMLSSKFGLTLPFTRQELADMAGTTTETAIRVIGHLKERGIVRSVRGKVIILDEQKLRLLSEGAPRV